MRRVGTGLIPEQQGLDVPPQTGGTDCPSLRVTEYRLRLARPVSPGEATLLRGYFGDVFTDEMLVHHHRPDGSLHYDYPRVQFKVIERTARLIGIEEGGPVVERLWREVDCALLGGEELPVLEGTLRRRVEPIGETPELVDYRLVTPWLGLNQENHRKYEASESDADRQHILGRVLVGNCLSLAKSFGHRVTCRLAGEVSGLTLRTCRLKGVPMIGFVGTFRVNFLIPAWLGIGKSVSRGFGTVQPVARAKEGQC